MTKALLFTLSKMIHTSGLPLNFRDVMPLDCRVEVCCGARPSADRGCITAAKGALASTLLNAKMRNGTPYGLVDLTDTRTPRTLTASAHEVFHLGQGQWTGSFKRPVRKNQFTKMSRTSIMIVSSWDNSSLVSASDATHTDPLAKPSVWRWLRETSNVSLQMRTLLICIQIKNRPMALNVTWARRLVSERKVLHRGYLSFGLSVR